MLISIYFFNSKKFGYDHDFIIQGAREDLDDSTIQPKTTCEKYFKFVNNFRKSIILKVTKKVNSMKIILTGSEGLIGKQLFYNLSKTNDVLKVDLSLGHDLTDEKFVKSWFKKIKQFV